MTTKEYIRIAKAGDILSIVTKNGKLIEQEFFCFEDGMAWFRGSGDSLTHRIGSFENIEIVKRESKFTAIILQTHRWFFYKFSKVYFLLKKLL